VFCGVQVTVNYDFMQQNCSVNNCIALYVLYHLTVQSPGTSYIYLRVYGP